MTANSVLWVHQKESFSIPGLSHTDWYRTTLTLWPGQLFLGMVLCGAQSDLPIHFTHHVLSRLTIVVKASLSIRLSDEAFPITLASQRFPLERVWLFYEGLLIGTQR